MTDTLFPEEPDRRYFPTGEIVRSAEIEGNYRWILKRRWGSGRTILWCGLNPSIANGEREDPTMIREIGFSYRWGFGGLVKVNIFPFITPDPKFLRRWIAEVDDGVDDRGIPVFGGCWPYDSSAYAAFLQNIARIRDEVVTADTCVAAWGNVEDDAKLLIVLDGLGLKVQWQCLGVNQNGSPKHTLARGKGRVPDTATLMPWGC